MRDNLDGYAQQAVESPPEQHQHRQASDRLRPRPTGDRDPEKARQLRHIPVETEGTAEQRGYGHVGVAQQDEQGIHGGQQARSTP